MLLASMKRAEEKCTHQLALPWGTRHPISPKLAGRDVMIVPFCTDVLMCTLRRLRHPRAWRSLSNGRSLCRLWFLAQHRNMRMLVCSLETWALAWKELN